MLPRIALRSCLILTIAFGVAPILTAQPKPASAARFAELAQYLQQIAEVQSAAKKCQWATPQSTAALSAMSFEFQTEAEALSTTGADQNVQALTVGTMRGGNRACTDNGFKTQAQGMADQAIAVLMARAKSIIGAEVAAGYAKDETTLSPRGALIDRMSGVVQAQMGAQYAQLKAAQDTVAASALRIGCTARKALRSATPRTCPALSADDQQRVKYADAVLRSAESVVESFASTVVASAPPAPAPSIGPPPLSSFGAPENFLKRVKDNLMDVTSPAICTSADYLFRLDDPEGLRMTGEHAHIYYLPNYAPVFKADGKKLWLFLGIDKADEFSTLVKAYNVSDKDTTGTAGLVKTIRETLGKPGDVYAAAQKSYIGLIELKYLAARVDYEPMYLRRCAVKKP